MQQSSLAAAAALHAALPLSGAARSLSSAAQRATSAYTAQRPLDPHQPPLAGQALSCSGPAASYQAPAHPQHAEAARAPSSISSSLTHCYLMAHYRPPYRAVLIDAAGTLLLPSEPAADVLLRFARPHGCQLSEWEVLQRFRRWAPTHTCTSRRGAHGPYACTRMRMAVVGSANAPLVHRYPDA